MEVCSFLTKVVVVVVVKEVELLLVWLLTTRAWREAANPSSGTISPFNGAWFEEDGVVRDVCVIDDWEGLSEKYDSW